MPSGSSPLSGSRFPGRVTGNWTALVAIFLAARTMFYGDSVRLPPRAAVTQILFFSFTMGVSVVGFATLVLLYVRAPEKLTQKFLLAWGLATFAAVVGVVVESEIFRSQGLPTPWVVLAVAVMILLLRSTIDLRKWYLSDYRYRNPKALEPDNT